MIAEWVKHRMIGTPLQRPAEFVRELAMLPKRIRYPELRDVCLEGQRLRRVISNAVRDGMNCLDVGCHLGSVFSELTRRSPSGKHIAIEPLPYKVAWLRKKFPQSQIVEAAVSDRDGEVEFSWNKSNPGFSSLAEQGPDGHKIERVKVRSLPLDQIVPAGHRIDFMKVDAEGAEFMVFRSAQRILSEYRPTVLFECARRSTQALGFEVDQVFDVLTAEHDYSIMFLHEYLADRRPLDLPAFKQAMIYPFQAFNFVAVPGKASPAVIGQPETGAYTAS